MENDSFELQGGAMLPEGMYAAAASVKGTPANVKSPRNDGINIANMSDEDLLSAINAPLTGEEVAVKMAELNNAGISINSSTISFDEFLAYDEWRKKQHFSFWGAVGDGVATAAVDIGKGVGSALTDPKKLALAAGLGAIATPAAGITAAYGASLIEGFARGTRDLAGLVVMAANHPSSPLYRMFINPDGDKQQSYKDFLDLAEWNNSTEDILKGKSNAFMPDRSTYEKLLGRKLGGQVDDFIGVNNHLATAASYILDPTVFLTFGAGSASKGAAKAIAAKAGTAALKSGHVGSQVAGAVAATAARNQFKATWLNSVGEAMVKMGGLVSRPLEAGYEAIANTAEKVLGVKGHFAPTSGNFNVTRVNPSKGHAPQSFTHGVLGAAGIYSIFQIPYAIPIASVYGVAKAVSYAGQTLADLGKATSKTAGKGVAQIALHSSGAFGGYMAELAKTTLKGGMYGGVIGGLAAGEEGAAGGIGTGVTLGAIGHNVGAIYGTVSGKFSMMQIQSEYKNRIKEYKDKGFILQAENMQKFYDDIAAEHGEEAAVRLAGQILTLEKGKNVSVALLSVDNMRNTLLMNPDFYTEVQLPQGQGAFGAGGRKKVLNDLGKLVLANGEAGGALWNGLFVEIDPKTGEVIRTPISQVRDRKTGRYHVIINIDAMRYARDENGNYIFDEIKGIERSEVRTRKPKTKEVDVTEEVITTETIEGPRRKMSASDPTVPKEDNTPVLVDEEGVPVEGETPTVEEEFVPADVARDRLVRARKFLIDQFGMSEAKGAIDKDGNVTFSNKNNDTAVILEKLTPEERIKVIKEHNKIASEYKAVKDVRVSKIEEIGRRYKKLSDANADDFAKKKITFDEFKKRLEALLDKKEKETELLRKEYKELENKRRAELATESLVDYILSLPLETRGEEMKQTLKFAEENPEHPQYTPQIIKRVKEILIEKGVMSKDGRFTKESTAVAKETKAPTPKAAPKAAQSKDIPARKQRVRSREIFGPARPLVIERKETRTTKKTVETGEFEDVVEIRETPATRKIPRIGGRVETATLSELYHLMNKVRRRVELGTEINSVVSRWLFGDANGEGWAFKDRAGAVAFMRAAYDKNIGPRGRNSQTAIDWKDAIDSYERDGKVDPRVQDAFDDFLEEIGESIFLGWESGKPFDYVFRGGDLGMVRNVVEALKDRMTNLFERNATNLGADINTKQAFFDWFKKNKSKFRADPHMETAFNDLIRIYQDKGMKNNGRTYRNLYTMPPAAVKEQAEYYGVEERIFQDAEGNWNWKSPERYNKDTHDNALLMVNELFDLANTDPEALNGLDFYIFSAEGMNPSGIEGQISKGFEALDKRSRSDFDPITQRTLDTQGVHAKGFLFSSADAKDIGPDFDDIQRAQISQTRQSGIYKQRPSIQEYGARGRPRTSLSGAMLADAMKAIAKGKRGKHLVVFRGIPTEKAFRIINKYVPKQVSKNVRLLAPIIADGGVSAPNVVNGQYLGFEQDQGGGMILDRSKGDAFSAREINFVPYEMEFRVTLRDPRNPQVDYKRPHFAFVARAYDMDALNRRIHTIWNENLEVRQAYNNINDYIKHVHSTMSEYSGSGMIPAVKFFGADEYARERRKYVVAAIGAAPTKDVREFYFGDVLSAGEADFHETHYRNALESVNHPWMSLRLDNLNGASVVEGEGIPNIRVNEKMYRRGMIPTPTHDDSPLMEGMYSASDFDPEIRRQWEDAAMKGQFLSAKSFKMMDKIEKHGLKIQWMRSGGQETPRTWVDSQRRIKSNEGEEWLLNIGRGEIGNGEPFYSPLAFVHARLNNDGSVIIGNVTTPDNFIPRKDFIESNIRTMADYLATYDESRILEIKKQIESDEKWIKRIEKQSPQNSKNPNTEIFKHLEGIRSRIRSLQSELTKLEEVADISTEEARASLVSKNETREYFLGRRQNISKSDVLNSKKLRDYYSEEWDRRTKSLYGFGSDNLGFLPEGLSRNDVITLLMAELSHRLGRMGGEIVKNKPAGGQLFSAGDGPIPLIVESIPDFHRSTEDGPFDYIKTIKNLSKPSRLIKTLNSHPIFNIKDKTFNFQPAEAFDARSLEEYDFLKSNFKWSEQKGDIFKSESVGRFVRMFGKDTTVVRHTLDEHLEVKNDTDTYNKNFATGKPVVFPVNYAEFKSEFFGPAYKGSNASTINAYVFSARQMTALNNMGNKDSSLRTLVGLSNPLVYDYKGEGKGSMPIERIHKMAVKNGHDGVIMQNVYEGGIIDTLVTIPKGKESNVLVLDRHLNDIPVPRNSGHPEGARVMFSSSDVPKLPEGAFGPNNPETVEISRGLKALKGMKTGDGKFIVKLNQDKSRKVGMEYETMKHDPYNPKVKAAYEALAKETEEQYQFILDAGYMPEMHMAPNEPYPNSRATIADLRERKRLKVFSTDYGYGETPITEKDIKENPMLRMSKYKDANGVPMRVNDLFRFVHDFFGHSERGNSFGPLGEENAWDVHARMFSPLARRAMTSETRGQNSWVNFIHEPNIEINRMRDTARRLEREGRFQEAMELRATIGSTRFADQKIGLMPEWTSKLDEELTPIESEMYGKHITSDANYGIYASAGDYPERIWSPTPEEFVSMSTKARSAHKYGTSVDVKNPADLAGYQLLVAGDGKAFAHVSPDGELGGVLRGLNGKSEDVVAIIEAALATKKVKWLSAFDTVLPEMYNAFGFEAVARIKFVDEYRPEGWDYSLYEKFNGGRPSVVFMSYVGGRAVPYRRQGGVLVGSYDDGVAIARSVSDAKFSAGDVAPDDGIPDPLTYDVSKLTPISRDNLKVLDLLAQYRNVAKDLRIKIDAGQITEAQANMALNKWNKDNNTGQTALSWSVHRTLDGEKKVYELTDSDIDKMRIDVIASDPVFKKDHLAAKKFSVARRIENEPPPEGLSNKEKIKWIAKRRFENKTIAYLRTLDAEQKEEIYKKFIPDFEAKQEAAGKEGEYSKKVKRLARRLFDKELAKLYKLRDEAVANGEPDPFGGVDSNSLEEIARENSIMEAVSQIDKIEQLDADDPIMEGDGDIGRYEKALLESGLSKEEAKALVERRRRDVLEVAEEENIEIEVPHEGILKHLTLEEHIAEIKEENKKYFDENGENLWEPNEIEIEAQRRVKARDEIISTFSEKVYSKGSKKPMNPNSLEFMAKVEFANTKWFDNDGNSILWRGEKTGREYQGPKGKDENGNETVGDQRVDEDLIAIYPDKMQNAIERMQKRLSEHLSGENILNYHDSSMTMLLDLYRLWGYEPNELLKEVDFRPRTESEAVRIATEEGLIGRQFTKLVLGLQGKLFTSVEGSSKLTERLESLPGFYTLTRDILSDVALGAEFKEGKLESAIEINKAQVEEMLKEFARVYPQYAKYIIIEGGTNVDAYIKRKWEASGKGKVEKNKWKKANNWEKGKDIPPEVSEKIKAELFAKWRTEAIGAISVRKGFLGEDSVKSEVYNVLMEENMRKKKILEARPRNPETGLLLAEHKMPIDPETGERMYFSTPEMIDIQARRTAKDIKFRFIEFLNEKAQEILIDEAERFEQEAGLKTLTPEQRQAKRRAERKAAVEAQQKALAEPETLEPETPVVEPPAPVVEAPKPVEPPKRTIVTETTGQVTEKQRNAENLRRAIAAAEEKGNVKDVTKTQVTGGKPKMPTDYGYKRGDKQGLWIHPNPRFTIQKVDTKLYTVKESQNVNGNIIEKNHGTFGSFEAAHSVVEKNVSAQTPPPMPPVATTAAPEAPKPVVTAPVVPVAPKPVTAATTPVVPPKATPQPPKPVGRPRKPVTAQETPKPVKNAIDKETERKVSQNTVKTPEQVGQAQAVVLQTGVVGASSPAVAPAVQTVLAVKDDLTLSQVQGAKGIFKSADGRFTVTKSKNGFKVRMNDHINPVIRADVQGRDIAFVNTLAEAQLAIREYEFYMRRRLESQGVNVGQILQALHPVKTPDQINGEAAQVARILNQQLSQMPNQSKPAIDNAVMQLAKDALAKLGMLKQDINVYLPLAIQSGIDPSDIQGIMKFVLTKGQVRAVYTSDSNIAHVATVNATGNVIPPSTPTVTIAPTNTGVQNATGATMPSQKPTTAPVGQTAKPVLNSQQLATVQALSTFIPHSSQIALPNGRKMAGVTYKNGSGYMIVQSGIGKWRVYNPAASLISVVDDEQDACNAILKDFYKR